MPTWLIKLFHSLGRKQAAKVTSKREGISQLPTQIEAEGTGAAFYTTLREAGFSDEALTKLIKSEKDIIRLVNKIKSMQNQNLKNIERKFFDPSGKMKPEGEDIVKKGLAGLEKKKYDDVTKKMWKDRHFQDKRAEFLKKYTKDGQPNDVELNALVTEHAILSKEAKRLGDAGEHYKKFSQLNTRTKEIEEILDFIKKEFPEDLASGGIAGELHLYDGGRIGLKDGKKPKFPMSRRTFLGGILGTLAWPFLRGFEKKAATKTVAPIAKEAFTRGADGIPSYAWDLINVVKAKGTKEIMEGIYKRIPPSTKYNYKGVEVVEDGIGGTSVKKEQTKTGHWYDEATDDSVVDDYVDREIGFEIKDGGYEPKDYDSLTKAPDEYNESTAYMQGDPDGGMDVSEIVEKIDDADHLELKQIADEVIDIRPKKAEGGRVSLSKGGLANILGV